MHILMLYNFLFGYAILRISGAKPEKFVNFLIHNKVRFWNLRKCESGDLYISISSRMLKPQYFIMNAARLGVSAEIFEKKGLRFFLERHKKRLGLYMGAFFSVIMIYISTLYVWDVKIEYSDFPDNSAVIELLKELGVKAGARIKNLEIDAVQDAVLMRDNRIKWIALNLSGTVIHTEIKKREPTSVILDRTRPQNIVAGAAGKITAVEAFEGQTTVKVGDAVKKGDLLISGLVDSATLGLRVKHATGRIMAETQKTIEVRIPYETQRKSFTGALETKKTISVLGRSVNLYMTPNPKFDRYERNSYSENLKILGFIEVPITVNSSTYSEVAVESVIWDENQAKNIALLKIDDIIESELCDLEIISKEYSEESDESFFYLKCRLVCLEDIAKDQPFETNIKTEK